MTQALQAKRGNRELSHAGRVLDQLVVAFLAAVARAIRHRRAKHRARKQTAISAGSSSVRCGAEIGTKPWRASRS